MKSISGTIANTLWTQGIIQEEDIDTCRYGLDIFISSALEIASILIIAAFVGNFFQAVLLFTAFIPLRIYAGGYHADTRVKCYLISVGVYAFLTLFTSVISPKVYATVSIILTLTALVTVLTSSPVIHKNKSVCEIERKYYRKLSISICLIESIIILILTVVLPQSPYIVSLAIGQAAVTVSMIAAIIKGKIADNK
ncbi:MAG: accessory gene regulator B family protein [Lachnospiraceae bacterium]|nr:accessory gene regulator B family protein [Lachnospiraceae bacterium]